MFAYLIGILISVAVGVSSAIVVTYTSTKVTNHFLKNKSAQIGIRSKDITFSRFIEFAKDVKWHG